jgi:hypothetical protein
MPAGGKAALMVRTVVRNAPLLGTLLFLPRFSR